MRKHRLLIYQQIGRRTSPILFLLLITLLFLGIIDQFTQVFGDSWWWLWLALPVVLLLWVYYAILTRRGAILVKENVLRLQGPLFGRNISYRRIVSVTSGKTSQHYPTEVLRRSERSLLKPFYNHTCVFVELRSYPRTFKRRNWWFPKFLFGSDRPGLLCLVDDWMELSRHIEMAKNEHLDLFRQQAQVQHRSPAAKILAEMDDF